MPRLVARVVLLASLLLAVACLPAVADMVIKLKDGSEIRLPIGPDDVESFSFEAAADETAAPDADAAADEPQSAEPATPAPEQQAAPEGTEPTGEALELPVPPPTTTLAAATTIRVGPTRKYKLPSQAARIAKDGDIVEIDAGLYKGDVALWRQDNLIIRGVGGRAHIDSQGKSSGGKAIWVISGANVTVANVELSGCRVPDLNGAGIRIEGTNFTLRNSYIHNNQMGVLSSPNANSAILIENSEFARNTVDYQKTGRLGHNIYIGRVHSFTLRGSYIHDASVGHNVKTRAAQNYIVANRIMDGPQGNASYLIDISTGGDSYVLGNLLHKSIRADNFTLISFASESGKDRTNARLYIVNNTAVSDQPRATLLRNHSKSAGVVANNIFLGGESLSKAPVPSRLVANLTRNAGLVDPKAFDYHLRPNSPAIDAGNGSIAVDGRSLIPRVEFVNPLGVRSRPRIGRVDIGAYEARK